MRCLALGQALRAQGCHVTFVTACQRNSLLRRLLNEDFQVITLEAPYPHPDDWQVMSRVLKDNDAAWVVLDGYHFDSAYQLGIKDKGPRLLVIDDTAHLEYYHADIVLNQNINANLLRYSAESSTLLLLGTQYVLLRPEFLGRAAIRKKIPEIARKVLITLGGADVDNQTLKAMQTVQQIGIAGLEAVVVVGASNPHLRQLQAQSRSSTVSIEVVSDVTKMCELMAWADVAVSGGGSTCWELAFMGLPAIVLILADNQRAVAEGLDEAGVVVNLGWHKDLAAVDITQALVRLAAAADQRTEMSKRGPELVDGKGNDRVLSELLARCSN